MDNEGKVKVKERWVQHAIRDARGCGAHLRTKEEEKKKYCCVILVHLRVTVPLILPLMFLDFFSLFLYSLVQGGGAVVGGEGGRGCSVTAVHMMVRLL